MQWVRRIGGIRRRINFRVGYRVKYGVPGIAIQTKEKKMKIMNCKQLGGACDKEFHANSFEEIAEMSKQHGMEMFQKKR